MTKHIQQALSDGYIDHNAHSTFDFNVYRKECQSRKQPFVRLEQRGAHCYVEVEGDFDSHYFTEHLHIQVHNLLHAILPAESAATLSVSAGLISCDLLSLSMASRVAVTLSTLALAAPSRAEAEQAVRNRSDSVVK